MATTGIEARVRHSGRTAIIDLPPLVDAAAELPVMKAYRQAAERDPRTVLLNFTGVDYINSTGIAVIVQLLARARTEGRAMATSALSPHYREIFEVTRLADFMTMYDDEASAVTKVEG